MMPFECEPHVVGDDCVMREERISMICLRALNHGLRIEDLSLGFLCPEIRCVNRLCRSEVNASRRPIGRACYEVAVVWAYSRQRLSRPVGKLEVFGAQ
jgi:hypothetical protein